MHKMAIFIEHGTHVVLDDHDHDDDGSVLMLKTLNTPREMKRRKNCKLFIQYSLYFRLFSLQLYSKPHQLFIMQTKCVCNNYIIIIKHMRCILFMYIFLIFLFPYNCVCVCSMFIEYIHII